LGFFDSASPDFLSFLPNPQHRVWDRVLSCSLELISAWIRNSGVTGGIHVYTLVDLVTYMYGCIPHTPLHHGGRRGIPRASPATFWEA